MSVDPRFRSLLDGRKDVDFSGFDILVVPFSKLPDRNFFPLYLDGVSVSVQVRALDSPSLFGSKIARVTLKVEEDDATTTREMDLARMVCAILAGLTGRQNASVNSGGECLVSLPRCHNKSDSRPERLYRSWRAILTSRACSSIVQAVFFILSLVETRRWRVSFTITIKKNNLDGKKGRW